MRLSFSGTKFVLNFIKIDILVGDCRFVMPYHLIAASYDVKIYITDAGCYNCLLLVYQVCSGFIPTEFNISHFQKKKNYLLENLGSRHIHNVSKETLLDACTLCYITNRFNP